MEPPKTHYNCHSHVWDAHVRHQLPPDHPLAQFVYKKLPDRTVVKGLCRAYMVELEDNDPSRKRRKRTNTDKPQQQQTQPKLPTNGSPIQDSITGEFYPTFREKLTLILLKVF